MSIIQINQCLERTKQQRNSNKRRYSSCFGETNNNEGNNELLCYSESHLQFASFGIASPRTTAKHFLYWYWQPLAVGSNLMQQIFCQYIANTLPLLRHICDTWKWWCIHMFSSFCAFCTYMYMCFTNKSRMWNNQEKCKGLWIFMYNKENCDKKQKMETNMTLVLYSGLEYSGSVVPLAMFFLAVQNSSIGDLVTDSLTH